MTSNDIQPQSPVRLRMDCAHWLQEVAGLSAAEKAVGLQSKSSKYRKSEYSNLLSKYM